MNFASWIFFPVSLVVLSACSGANEASSADQSDDELRRVSVLGAEPRGTPTHYPILLASGFASSPKFNNFSGALQALGADGHQVYVADLPPFESTEVRGAVLAHEIDVALQKFGTTKVNIIAHSAGGTAAREAISRLGYGNRVASLTTISTPHRGSRMADVVLAGLKHASDDVVDAFATLVGRTFSDMANDSRLEAALTSMSEPVAREFDASHHDDPNVYYQSWAGVAGVGGLIGDADDAACEFKRYGDRRVDGTIRPTLVAMALAMGTDPQDAAVTVASAKHGVFRGCVPGDHLDEIGGSASAPEVDPHSGFDHIRFYRTIAFELTDKGF